MTATVDPRSVVLVEGESDRRALLTLAARLGRDLGSEGVDVVSMRGVTNIRALGADAVESVIEAAGEGRSLRLLRRMPAQQGWSREAVLRRFLGVRSGRKAKYAELLVDALEPARVPEPLSAVLGRV